MRKKIIDVTPSKESTLPAHTAATQPVEERYPIGVDEDGNEHPLRAHLKITLMHTLDEMTSYGHAVLDEIYSDAHDVWVTFKSIFLEISPIKIFPLISSIAAVVLSCGLLYQKKNNENECKEILKIWIQDEENRAKHKKLLEGKLPLDQKLEEIPTPDQQLEEMMRHGGLSFEGIMAGDVKATHFKKGKFALLAVKLRVIKKDAWVISKDGPLGTSYNEEIEKEPSKADLREQFFWKNAKRHFRKPTRENIKSYTKTLRIGAGDTKSLFKDFRFWAKAPRKKILSPDERMESLKKIILKKDFDQQAFNEKHPKLIEERNEILQDTPKHIRRGHMAGVFFTIQSTFVAAQLGGLAYNYCDRNLTGMFWNAQALITVLYPLIAFPNELGEEKDKVEAKRAKLAAKDAEVDTKIEKFITKNPPLALDHK